MSDESTLADRVAALEQRLAVAEAHQAITNLKSEYGSLSDARYTRKGIEPQSVVDAIADRVANLFSEDGVWDGGAGLGRCEGRDAIRERFRRPTLIFSWHFFVKPRILVEGDTATGTWDIFCPLTTAEERAMWMVGVEHDEYVRIDGVWLHRKMELDAKLMAPHDRGWA